MYLPNPPAPFALGVTERGPYMLLRPATGILLVACHELCQAGPLGLVEGPNPPPKDFEGSNDGGPGGFGGVYVGGLYPAGLNPGVPAPGALACLCRAINRDVAVIAICINLLLLAVAHLPPAHRMASSCHTQEHQSTRVWHLGQQHHLPTRPYQLHPA